MTKLLVLLLSLFGLSACQGVTAIDHIVFVKDSRVSGTIEIVPSNDSSKMEIAPGDEKALFAFSETRPLAVTVSLRPEGKDSDAVISSQVRIFVKPVIQGGQVIRDGKIADYNCDKLFQASIEGKTLQIQFLGFQDLTSCQK